jgi:hypothetical protein
MYADIGFATMYAFKACRAALTYFALEVATRVHSSYYIEKVYGRNEDPPPIWMLAIVVTVVFAVANGIVYAGLSLWSVATVPVVRMAMSEGLSYSLIVTALVGALSYIVTDDAYFAYYSDGLRALRAFRQIVLAFAIPVCLLPFPFVLPLRL